MSGTRMLRRCRKLKDTTNPLLLSSRFETPVRFSRGISTHLNYLNIGCNRRKESLIGIQERYKWENSKDDNNGNGRNGNKGGKEGSNGGEEGADYANVTNTINNRLRVSFWETLRSYGGDPPENWPQGIPPPPPPGGNGLAVHTPPGPPFAPGMLVDYGLSLPNISHWYLGTYEGCPVRVFVALYLETLFKLSFQVLSVAVYNHYKRIYHSTLRKGLVTLVKMLNQYCINYSRFTSPDLSEFVSNCAFAIDYKIHVFRHLQVAMLLTSCNSIIFLAHGKSYVTVAAALCEQFAAEDTVEAADGELQDAESEVSSRAMSMGLGPQSKKLVFHECQFKMH
ncbi:hypothetical protein NC653_031235 [Populus alba x Populus x berolinensis]|uniref:Uncharacterized protein n=1 Tax=Populus alba x Populus x berolinensis TaxID=444605 RepID=A0AAD6LXV0_9ROSI|nr:hypothetical protein NC653_031235 [Populus alba x Populus x berolinensis]